MVLEILKPKIFQVLYRKLNTTQILASKIKSIVLLFLNKYTQFKFINSADISNKYTHRAAIFL